MFKKDEYQLALKALKRARRDGEKFMLYIQHDDEDGTESVVVHGLRTSSIISMVVYLMSNVNGLSDCIKMYLSDVRH